MKKKVIIAGLVVVVLGAIAWANIAFKRAPGVTVTSEKIEKRDLESIVSASGKIQPKSNVNISAETSGKVVGLYVNEGDAVTAGQLLLQIDPKNLESNVQNREASLATQKSQLESTKAQIENAKVALAQAEENLKRAKAQWENGGLISKDALERAQNDVKMQTTNLAVAEQSVKTQELRIKVDEANLDSANYDLKKLSIASPINGIVTKRNIEKGETAVVGTMNNAGTVLLTIADLSIIETEVEVDEADIPYIKVGQLTKVTIDAFPNKTFPGRVTEVGNSPIQTGAAATGRATTFKVTVTIDGVVPNVRPGFTCTAVITTATRDKSIAVPIQAMTLREMIVDERGEIVRAPTPAPGAPPPPPATGPAALKAGETRKEMEGVFIVKDGRAVFTPVQTGIAGEKYFEVLSGLKETDEVIIGPFASVRNMRDGDQVKATVATPNQPGTTSTVKH
jgi:HlyD family secretion protein